MLPKDFSMQVLWFSGIAKMENYHLLKIILLREVASGQWKTGTPPKRYKNSLKSPSSLIDLCIVSGEIEFILQPLLLNQATENEEEEQKAKASCRGHINHLRT